jgi:hypothetical protein
VRLLIDLLILYKRTKNIVILYIEESLEKKQKQLLIYYLDFDFKWKKVVAIKCMF